MTIAVAKAFMDARQDATDEEIHLLLKRSMRELGKAFPYAGYGGRFSRWLQLRRGKFAHIFHSVLCCASLVDDVPALGPVFFYALHRRCLF